MDVMLVQSPRAGFAILLEILRLVQIHVEIMQRTEQKDVTMVMW